MITERAIKVGLAALCFWAVVAAEIARGQGNGFTYQGRLLDGGKPANGNYDLSFSLVSTPIGGPPVAPVQTNLNVTLTNGVFSVLLNFGGGPFNGTNLWLVIGVRTNGIGAPFISLYPPHSIDPSPYAIAARTLTGPLVGDASALTNLQWTSVAGKPTTVAGYGISDGITASSVTNLVTGYAQPHSATLDQWTNIPVQNVAAAPSGALASMFRTPPMGLNTWYYGGTSINEYSASNAINTMASNGMVAAGYVYYNLDDGWAAPRDTNGNVTVVRFNGTTYPQFPMLYATNAFPHGMAYLANLAHSKGMKFGLYTSSGITTCAGYTGSGLYVSQDVSNYARWGVDYLKVEVCGQIPPSDTLALQLYTNDVWGGFAKYEYEKFVTAIQATHRPIFLNCSMWWDLRPWLISEINSWRGIGDDARGTPEQVYRNELYHFDFIAYYSYMTGPGHFVDPDIILTGDMTPNQLRCIFSAYAMMSAPLLVADPVVNLTILTNADMISIDQDPLVMPAHVIGTNAWQTNMWASEDNQFFFPKGADQQVWVKNLQVANGNRKAVMFLNRSTNSANMSVNWTDIGIPANMSASVRDAWANSYAGNFVGSYSTTVPPESVVLLKIAGGESMPMIQLGGLTYLSDIGWLSSSTNGIGISRLGRDESAGLGRPIQMGGVTYQKGFGAYGGSKLDFYLGGLANRFHSDYGFDDDSNGFNSIKFQVWGDGLKLYDSGAVYNSPSTVDISVAGVTNLSLITVPLAVGSNCTVDWGNTYVTASLAGDGGGLTNLSSTNLTGSVPSSLLTAVPADSVVGGLTTNLAVLAPGGRTNTLFFTNGVLRAVR